MDDCAGLENRYTSGYRGFESHSLRHYSIHETQLTHDVHFPSFRRRPESSISAKYQGIQHKPSGFRFNTGLNSQIEDGPRYTVTATSAKSSN